MTVPGGLRNADAQGLSPGAHARARKEAAIPSPKPEATGQTPEVSALLARAAAGDQDAWRGIVTMYARRVFALARSRRLSEEAAEEVAQSVFVTLASQLGSGSYAERGRFESWLFRVAINRVRDEARRASRHAATTDPVSLNDRPAPAEPAIGADERELASLRAALASLSESDREVVDLRHHGGLSFKQIADLLDEPMGTVLARHHRALRKLKEVMEIARQGAGS